MTQADELLRMIEAVDPADTAKMDEIDFMIGKYIGRDPYHSGIVKYTRSLDALKAIEHPEWRIETIYYDPNGHTHIGYRKAPYLNTSHYRGSPFLPTWELAQAHAIVQITAHERQNHDQ